MKSLTSAILILAGAVGTAGGAIAYAEATGSAAPAGLAVTVGLAATVLALVRSGRDFVLGGGDTESDEDGSKSKK